MRVASATRPGMVGGEAEEGLTRDGGSGRRGGGGAGAGIHERVMTVSAFVGSLGSKVDGVNLLEVVSYLKRSNVRPSPSPFASLRDVDADSGSVHTVGEEDKWVQRKGFQGGRRGGDS